MSEERKKAVVAFWKLVGWDGGLPLLVAAAPVLVKAIFPKGHIVEVATAVLLPAIVALIRASVGRHQIARIWGGCLPLMRQAAEFAAE